MMCNYLKRTKYILILIIGIFPRNDAIKLRTRMSISGSLNHLCENDPNSSDELPSCKCLEQFSAQGNVLVGTYPDNLGTPIGPSVLSHDLTERTYKNIDDLVLAVGGNKVTGLKCINEDGEQTELAPVYSYLVYLRYSVISNTHNGMFSIIPPPKGNPSKANSGIFYKKDMTEENSAVIASATIIINGSTSSSIEDLGKICINTNKPKSIESFVWNVVNQVLTNSSKTCNIPKDTYFPTNTVDLPTVITVDEPLECGTYEAYVDVSLRLNELWALGFKFDWKFAYNRYCQYFES